VAVSGNVVCGVGELAGLGLPYLDVIDVSDPAHPSLVNTHNFDEFVRQARDISVFGDHVFVLRFNEGLQVFGINVPPSDIHLSAESAGDGWRLRWPSTATGFMLESSTNPAGSNWVPVPGTPQVNGDDYELNVPMDSPARYWRLRKIGLSRIEIEIG
jgi:hypothetical protein